MEVWKMIFLFKQVILRFHVKFPGCIRPYTLGRVGNGGAPLNSHGKIKGTFEVTELMENWMILFFKHQGYTPEIEHGTKKSTQVKRKIIFHTSIFRFHVQFQGSTTFFWKSKLPWLTLDSF